MDKYILEKSNGINTRAGSGLYFPAALGLNPKVAKTKYSGELT